MRYFLWISVLLLLAAEPVYAALPDSVENLLDHDALSLLEDAGADENGTPGLLKGLSILWERGGGLLADAVRESLRGGVLLLVIVLLCAMVQDCLLASGQKDFSGMTVVAGGLCITWVTAGDLQSLMGLGVQTIGELEVFSRALLPTLGAAVAAGGGIVSAGVRQVASVFFTDILILLIRGTLVPLVYVYVTATAADLLLPGRQLRAVAKGINKVTVWLLSGILVVYTSYLMLAGTAAGTADSMSARLTRAAMGTVPVVGRIIADAAETVLTGAAAVKNAVGIAGLLAVLAMCLAPFIRLAVQYLLYKLVSLLAGMVGPPSLVELIDALGGAFGLVLGMAAACGVMVIVSLMGSVMAVSI